MTCTLTILFDYIVYILDIHLGGETEMTYLSGRTFYFIKSYGYEEEVF